LITEELLKEILTTENVDVLVNIMNDRREHESVRVLAIVSMTKFADAKTVQPLIDTLRDHHATVRDAAKETLSKFDANLTLQPLIQVLRDDSEVVREFAVTSMKKIGDAPTLPILEDLLSNDPNKKVRKAAKKSIRAISKRT